MSSALFISGLTRSEQDHFQGLGLRNNLGNVFPPTPPSSAFVEGCSRQPAKKRRRRPPHSYAALITQAIVTSENQRLSLREIYKWIQTRYPQLYKADELGWQNTIRHNLSLNKCFVKVPRTSVDGPETTGKGCYWAIDAEELGASNFGKQMLDAGFADSLDYWDKQLLEYQQEQSQIDCQQQQTPKLQHQLHKKHLQHHPYHQPHQYVQHAHLHQHIKRQRYHAVSSQQQYQLQHKQFYNHYRYLPTPPQQQFPTPTQQQFPTPPQQQFPTPPQQQFPTPPPQQFPTPQQQFPTPPQQQFPTPPQQQFPTPPQQKFPTPPQQQFPTPPQQQFFTPPPHQQFFTSPPCQQIATPSSPPQQSTPPPPQHQKPTAPPPQQQQLSSPPPQHQQLSNPPPLQLSTPPPRQEISNTEQITSPPYPSNHPRQQVTQLDLSRHVAENMEFMASYYATERQISESKDTAEDFLSRLSSRKNSAFSNVSGSDSSSPQSLATTEFEQTPDLNTYNHEQKLDMDSLLNPLMSFNNILN